MCRLGCNMQAANCDYEPTNGSIVACKDDATLEEGEVCVWMRAKVEELLTENKARVFFLDYGHR